MSDFDKIVTSVKSSYDIVEYMRTAGLNLKNAGVSKWKTNCPFHNEKTPSFHVSESFQNFKCWGCGKNGDLITFVMDYENLSFTEALYKLAEDKGIDIDVDTNENSRDIKSLQQILKIASVFYCTLFDRLPDNHAAKKEIESRGLTWDNSSEENIKYGYSPAGDKLYKLLNSKGFSDDLIVESGVCRKNDNGQLYDFFRSRLMFIFTDRYGKPIGFSSRKLFEDDKRGKYVNSSDTPLFHKSKVLYNHSKARKNVDDKLYVTEGQFDVAAFVEAGVLNVVAASGTSFTKEHVFECSKMVNNDGRIIFCFDGDEAGAKAAARIFTSFPEIHNKAYVVVFPENEDPCDYRLKNGNNSFLEYLNQEMPLIEFMILNAKKKYDMKSLVEKSNYVQEAASIVKTVSSVSLRENCMQFLSLEAMTPLNVIRETVENVKPFEFVSEKTRIVAKEEVEKDDQEDSKENDLIDLMKNNTYYNFAARFIQVGMMRVKWRESVVRSKNLIPKRLRFFVDDLEKMEGVERIFPEMFSNVEIANFIFNEEFSSFYSFMSLSDLKNNFVFLHDELEKMKSFLYESKMKIKTKQLLKDAEPDDVEYFSEILKKEESLLNAI